MKKYGVKLITYCDADFNLWVYDDLGRFESLDINKAYDVCSEYSSRNPKGIYQVLKIEEENV